MTFFRNIILLFLIIGTSSNSLAQYITVDDTKTAQQLVENVLINSPCAGVSNFSVSGANFGTGQNSYGYFTAGTSGFPFSDGIVLSTSKAISTQGPNNSVLSDNASGWNGDSDLEQALSISNTSNATILEFDFTPLTSKVSFDYLFASEEYYGSSTCRYSDGFAFLLKIVGSTTPYQNLALVPNTTIPVKVTTVHPDIPGVCGPENPSYFGSFNNVNWPINFNGQTIIMTANATVIPGTVYHIKLVIADETNPQYDSAIFLGGGSFNVGTDLGPDQLIATNNPVCQGKTYTLDATEAGLNSYKWFKNNIDTGITSQTFTVSSAGIYRAEVTLGSTTCKAIGEVAIEYSPLPTLVATTIVQCDEDHDGTTLFDLTKVDTIIKNNDATLSAVTYYENLIDAQNQNTTLAILNPTMYQSIPKTIHASVKNSFGCANTTTLDLLISNNTVANFRDLESCDLDGDLDGYYAFDLSVADSKVLLGLPLGLVVQYYPTINDALLQTNLLPNIFTNTIRFQMIIYAKIINGADCYGIIPLHLYVNSNEPDNFEDEEVFLCDGKSKKLEVATTFNTYSWSNDATNTTFSEEVSTPGEYKVTITDNNTCEATKKFIVSTSFTPTITSVEVKDFQENSNSVLINYTSNDNQFSLDGVHFQNSPNFENVATGEYTVWVKNSCGFDTKKINVLNYPKYFTPNGDGFNDLWTVANINSLPYSKISIFDRFGKFLFQFNGNQKGWDGKLNSKDLPSEDYWFELLLDNNKVIKGHFTLKR